MRLYGAAFAGVLGAVLLTSFEASAQDPSSEASRSANELAGFGGLGWLGFGVPSGDDAGPAQSVFGPSFALELHAEASFAFVYAGAGYQRMRFSDKAPTTQSVVNVDSGDEFDVEASANTNLFHAEVGLAHGFKLGNGFFGVRPGIGFGIGSDGEVVRDIANCTNCTSSTVLDAYKGGRYLRAQLGGYIVGKPVGFGIVVSYQQFLGEVNEPALNSVLMFNLTVAGGGGL